MSSGRQSGSAAKRSRPPGPPAHRLVALFVIMALGLSGILVRLVVLQVNEASAYETLALDQRVRDIPLPASRGTIFDRNGQELAMSLPAKAVFADPAIVDNPSSEARVVASMLGLDRPSVQAKLSTKATDTGRPIRFVYLARGVSVPTARALERKQLPGIGFQDESRRYYPAGALAPQVLGFVGVDGTGLAGLESQYESKLAGRPGREVVEEGLDGTFIPQGTSHDVPPVAGGELMLTIDKDIQYRAQVSLAHAVKDNGAKGGTLIAMDPRTGDILAMATYPWFDPNRFAEADPDRLRNRAVTDMYEPGSANKVITAAAALEEGVIRPTDRLEVPDRLQVSNKLFHDAHEHPTEQMTLGDILAYSSNIGAIKVAERLGRDRLSAYLHRFGFGHVTGLGFPGEARGLLAPPDQWWGTSMGTIPIGQGIAVTPLQMASVYATVANGGVWIEPRLVRAIVGPNGRERDVASSPTRRVVSAETAGQLVRMLAYGVEVGTGTEAQIPGYWVAGKTGTARKPLTGALGYSDHYVASFIGFTPATRPALVVAVVLDEPETVFGGVAAAPLFRDVARFALAKLRVAPAPRPPLPPHAVPTG
ncbi:MAG TPA: penicillin-binding protein 2 [Actinomycetota bacterium]|nr:penicillin-binding protein 2 [Actinomycetota bacterium]